MRRAEPLTDGEWAALDATAFAGLPVEHKRCSFGAIGGRVIAVDYGG